MRQPVIILGFIGLAAGGLFAPTQLTITNSPPSTGIVGTAYSFTFMATGGSNFPANYSWNIFVNTDQGQNGLPPGITPSSSGLISGTPTTVGTYSFTVQVTDTTNPQDPHYNASGIFTIKISPCAPIITPTSTLPTGEAD